MSAGRLRAKRHKRYGHDEARPSRLHPNNTSDIIGRGQAANAASGGFAPDMERDPKAQICER